MIVHIVALNDVRVIYTAEDLDFTADLAANGIVVVTVNHFEGENTGRRTMDGFINGAATAAADSVVSLEFREVDELGLLRLTRIVTRRRSRVRSRR